MAHSLSAKKRIRQNAKHRALNRWRKRSFRDMIKDYREALLHGSLDDCNAKLKALYKRLDQVAAKGTIHRNTAARYKSRLAARLNQRKANETATAATSA
ncbi:MAG: 30S ribosomal protein S20 [Phycisphaeraceae bacterium]|nr:30S ribosomal protein S20 [Phycisphaeraceae bacterium]